MDKFESDRFDGRCGTCGQEFMAENVSSLVDIVVTLRDFITSEFGDNEYHDKELIRVLKSLGHDFHLSEDKEVMILGGEEK